MDTIDIWFKSLPRNDQKSILHSLHTMQRLSKDLPSLQGCWEPLSPLLRCLEVAHHRHPRPYT